MVLSTAVLGVGSVAASHTGSTVYVDASNTGTEDGSQANPFNTIQEGVNHALAGDTVLVAAGTYAETVDIRKPLTVEADGSVTLRPGGSVGFLIRSTEDVTVRGFSIGGFAYPVRLEYVQNVTIADNTITGGASRFAIFAYRTSDSTIEGNSIDGDGTYPREGIHLRGSADNLISDNSIVSSGVFNLHFIDADRNTVTRNEVVNARHSGARLAYGSTDNLIYDNTFANNRNVYPSGDNGHNTWNVSPRAGPNVVGGPEIGGNFWSNPLGSGFSDTASDADEDGFADSPYSADGVTDPHPLVSVPVAPPVVTTSAGETTFTLGGGAVTVDPHVIASATGTGYMQGARVVIQNLQVGDTLDFTAQHGITGSYDSSSGVLTLTGTATPAQYQDVFRSVIFENADGSADTTDRRITFSLSATVPYDGNGHFYEYVPASGVTWHQANQSASSKTLFGLQGYLVTVTSPGENDFALEKVQGNSWIGASDDTALSVVSKDSNGHDRWYWVTGPEKGTHFWTGDHGETVNQLVSGEYANWLAGEPNDVSGDGSENYAHFWYTHGGEWNDLPNGHGIDGFVVEYGGMAGDPPATWQDTKTVEVVEEMPVVETSAGDTDYVLGDPSVFVDPAVVSSEGDGDTYDGARVVIQNLHQDDVLAFTTQHGVTGSYDSSSGVLTLSGTASAAQYQDVFRSVTFANANTNADATDRRITFSLGSTLPFDGTGHFYEYIDAPSISWHDANASANSKSYVGLQGYLATVTSQAENDFVAQKLQGDGWIGASDDTAFSYISKTSQGYDQWYWVTGPEKGTHFWTGDEREAISEGVSGQYANWAANEPNDHPDGTDVENFAHFWVAFGQWNDLAGTWADIDGYVVEYGGLEGDAEITWQDTKTVAVTSPNVAPTLGADAAAVTADEGTTASNGGTVTDPDVGDSVSLTASVGTVVDNGDGTWSWSLATTDGPEDSQTVTITAEDSFGETASVSFDLTVENVAPSVNADSTSVTVDEGQTVSNTGSYADPGDDTVSVSASAGRLVDNGDGTWSWSFDSTDGPDDSQPVTITATDSDGASTTTTFSLVVNNVAPTVDADSASVTVDEGQTAVNTGTYADPGDDIVTITASVGTVSQSGGTWSWSFDAIDGPTDSQTVTITASDSDNAVTTTTFDLTVDNVAPDLTSADVDDGVAGSPVSATGSFGDAGVADTHTVTIDWGDGTSSSATVTQGAGGGSFDGSHVYATGGFYDVTVTVTDDDGGVDTSTAPITVAHLATIDVKPDSSENPVNPKAKGVLPVAILNTGDFDLTQVDVSTLRLSATEGASGAAAAHDGHLEEVDDDGDLDLLLHFVNADIGLDGDTTTVYLSGFMDGGVPVVGSDVVDPVPVANGDDDDDAGAGGNGNGRGNDNGRGR